MIKPLLTLLQATLSEECFTFGLLQETKSNSQSNYKTRVHLNALKSKMNINVSVDSSGRKKKFLEITGKKLNLAKSGWG